MDFFDYICHNSPENVRYLINSFGYNIDSNNLSDCARDLVNYEGEQALKKMMELHPDKEIILHYFEKSYETPNHISRKEEKKLFKMEGNKDIMLLFFMGATLLITAAIITK